MTTRRKRYTVTDDNEIDIQDDVQAKYRKVKPNKKKKQVEVKQEAKNKEEDILADFDLEGVPEEEREQIKLAILASREENNAPDQEGFIELDKDEEMVIKNDDDDGADTATEMSDEDILSETIKPHKTNLLDPDDPAYYMPTQKDEKTKPPTEQKPDDLEQNEDKDVQSDEEGVLDFSRSTLNDDDVDDDCETQQPESQIEETLDYVIKPNMNSIDASDIEEIDIDDVPQNNDDGKPETSHTTPHQSQGHPIEIPTTSSFMDKGQRSCEGVTNMNQRSKERSQSTESQESGGFLPSAQQMDNQTSQGSLTSNDPLQRHYRAVRVKNHGGPSYYCPMGIDSQKYAKVILQLFDIYNKKLRHAQKLVGQKLQWPESVKTGQHHEKSIDAKRRGHTVQIFDLSEYDDDNDFRGEPSKADGNPSKICRIKESDDDLPELYVEDVEDSRKKESAGIKKARFTAVEAAQIISEEIENEVTRSRGKSVMKEITNNEKHTEEIGKRNPAVSKVIKGSRKTPHEVLVADTQLDDYEEDIFERKKGKRDIIVEETQISDDEDWLNVNRNTDRIQTIRQRDSLRGYRIPRKFTEKNTNSNSDHYRDYKETIIRKINIKKRKVETPAKVLVEDTQDFGFDELNRSSKRIKKLNSESFPVECESSEDESVAETQPHVSPAKEEVKENKPQGFLDKVKSTIEGVISPAKKYFRTDRSESSSIKRSEKKLTESYSKQDNRQSRNIDVKAGNDSEYEPVGVVFGVNYEQTSYKNENSKSFIRNASKDSIKSNNSDSVSVTSSQISTTLLDDNGDLYSTQFCEMRNNKKSGRKRKQVDQQDDGDLAAQTDNRKNVNAGNADDSDEDVVVINIEVKDKGGDKESHKHARNIKQRVTRNRKIDDWIDQEDPTMSLKNNVGVNKKASSAKDETELELLDESPFPKTYSKRQGRNNEMNNAVVSEEAIKLGAKSTTKWKSEPNSSSPRNNTQSKKLEWVVEDMMAPVDLQNFSDTKHSVVMNKRHTLGRQLNQLDRGHNPEVFNVDTDEEEIRGEDFMRENEPFNVELKNSQSVNRIECPLCGKHFSVDMIEEHAGNCEGPETGGETDIPQGDDPSKTNVEFETCWVCEQQIPKAGSEKHVQECWNKEEERQKQQNAIKEEPVLTRRGKIRNEGAELVEPVTQHRTPNRKREHTDRH